MKELVITGLALTGLIVVLIWGCQGTTDRCPTCGEMLNTSYAPMRPGGELMKFCLNCGYTNAPRWEAPQEQRDE